MNMKCEGCVNAVKSKLETIEGRFLRLFSTSLVMILVILLCCFFFCHV